MAYHLLVDICGVDKNICMNDKKISEVISKAAALINAEVLTISRYNFHLESPPGCTVFAMLDTSHISVHTYASSGKMAIDIFISKDKKYCDQALIYIADELGIDHTKLNYTIKERFTD